MAVKPEMSMNATVPSTSRHSSLGLSLSQSIVRRGTNETSSAEDGVVDEGVAVTRTF
jgi:hypothetical protein